MRKWACTVGVLVFALSLPHGAEEPDSATGLGWAGADLAQAQILASRTRRPILVFARSDDCLACDRVEKRLTLNSDIVPLTEPYIRLLLSTAEPQGAATAVLLGITLTPTVLILGPDGMEAIRSEQRISSAWLMEQLQVITRRHQEREADAAPSAAALGRSLALLLDWGDLAGVERIHVRLAGEETQATQQRTDALPGTHEISTQADLATLLDRLDDPGEMRRETHLLALALEQEGRPGMSLAAYHHIIARLAVDPLSEARAAFLATRQRLPLAGILARLDSARAADPRSVPILMAIARVAEEMGRIYKAFHALEAAALYAPADAWITLELHRLHLLVQIRSRKLVHEPA